MTAALQKAIAGLYEAFSCEPKPSAIGWCNCDACAPKENVSVLISKPLRSLAPDELSHYASSAFLTAGSEADFKYFLPRILEILVIEDGWWPSPEVVGRAITNAGWNHFSASQKISLLSFFNEVLINLIENKNGWAIDEWICGIARGVPDLQPYLNLIEKNPSALIAFYEENSETLNKERLKNSFWDKESPNEKILLGWFQSERIKNLINETYGLK
jgi:hypothetical protein